MPLWLALEEDLRPAAMALTSRGVHFWYATPEARRLADGYVAWSEIAYIGMRGAGKSKWWALERRNGVAEDIGFLTPKNRRALIGAWERRGS